MEGNIEGFVRFIGRGMGLCFSSRKKQNICEVGHQKNITDFSTRNTILEDFV